MSRQYSDNSGRRTPFTAAGGPGPHPGRLRVFFNRQKNNAVRFNRRIPLSREGILRYAQNDTDIDMKEKEGFG